MQCVRKLEDTADRSAGSTLSGGNQTVEHCVIREATGTVEVRCGSDSGKAIHGVVTGRTMNRTLALKPVTLPLETSKAARPMSILELH